MTDKEETRFIDLGVTMPMRKKKTTTALYLALMGKGQEVEAAGYARHTVTQMRSLFEPATGNMVLIVERPDFGEVMHPVEIHGFALIARDAIITTQRLPEGPQRMGPMRIKFPNVTLFKIPLIG